MGGNPFVKVASSSSQTVVSYCTLPLLLDLFEFEVPGLDTLSIELWLTVAAPVPVVPLLKIILVEIYTPSKPGSLVNFVALN